MESISKEVFLKYEEIRKSGKYNMFTDCMQVMKKMKVSKEVYVKILSNYTELYNKYIGGK